MTEQLPVAKAKSIRVGLQLAPQHCSIKQLRAAWRGADDLGVDHIWLWDHFFPIKEPLDGSHYECMTLLSAMAADTRRAEVGLLVTCAGYRNADLLADMIRTVDHIAGGRAVLGLGSGWSSRDFTEYGYEFLPPGERHRNLLRSLARIRNRFDLLVPPPMRQIPLLIGGDGERTIRLAAETADIWNGHGPLEEWTQRNARLTEVCRHVGRDQATIRRSALVKKEDITRCEEWIDAGATDLVLRSDAPFDLDLLAELMARASAYG